MCTLRWNVKCLRHLFLRRYIQKGKGHSKYCTPLLRQIIPKCLVYRCPNLVCGLPKHLAVIWWVTCLSTHLLLISSKALHFQPCNVHKIFVSVTSSNHHNSAMLQVIKKNNWNCHITAKCFGKPHKPNLGICRPGSWELSLPLFGGCNFLSDPCLFGCIF